MLLELIKQKFGEGCRNYREFRDLIKNYAQERGWKKLKREIGFENWRKQYFNVSFIKTKGLSFIYKRKTEKYYYFDIYSSRAYKNSPQIKVQKDLIQNPENFNLESLNKFVPLVVIFQNEIAVRFPKAVCGGGLPFLDETLQINIQKQKIPFQKEKSKKVFIGLFDEKETYAGSWSRVFLDKENCIFNYKWTNTSYGGTHWEKGILLVLNSEEVIRGSYVLHGAKILRKKEEFEL